MLNLNHAFNEINLLNMRFLKKYNFTIIESKNKMIRFSLLLYFLICSCYISNGASPAFHLTKIDKPIYSILPDSSVASEFPPIKGKVISPFGYRGHHKHTGTDIKLHKGDTVRAAYSGIVTKASRYCGYGNLVILKHPNSIQTYYGHLSKCLVNAGDSVVAGQIVGLGGRTGRASTDHLHFEIRVCNVPKNPEKYFNFNTCTVKNAVLANVPVLFIKDDPKVEETADAKPSNDIVSIQKGDTLYALARRYGVTVKQIQELNNLESSNLKIGMKLKIN